MLCLRIPKEITTNEKVNTKGRNKEEKRKIKKNRIEIKMGKKNKM